MPCIECHRTMMNTNPLTRRFIANRDGCSVEPLSEPHTRHDSPTLPVLRSSANGKYRAVSHTPRLEWDLGCEPSSRFWATASRSIQWDKPLIYVSVPVIHRCSVVFTRRLPSVHPGGYRSWTGPYYDSRSSRLAQQRSKPCASSVDKVCAISPLTPR